MSDENKKKRGGDDNGKSFWQTLPGIITAITGLIGAVLIGLALWSSVRHNRQELRG